MGCRCRCALFHAPTVTNSCKRSTIPGILNHSSRGAGQVTCVLDKTVHQNMQDTAVAIRANRSGCRQTKKKLLCAAVNTGRGNARARSGVLSHLPPKTRQTTSALPTRTLLPWGTRSPTPSSLPLPQGQALPVPEQQTTRRRGGAEKKMANGSSKLTTQKREFCCRWEK